MQKMFGYTTQVLLVVRNDRGTMFYLYYRFINPNSSMQNVFRRVEQGGPRS